MRSIRQRHTLYYIWADYAVAVFVWACFFAFRKVYWQQLPFSPTLFQDVKFLLGIALIPLFWLLLYLVFDNYKDIYRLSRMETLVNTLFLSLFGTLIIFFMLILDDAVVNYKSYYTSFFVLFALHFSTTSLVRLFLLTQASHRLKSGKITFNALLVGNPKRALALYAELQQRKRKLGQHFLGFISTNQADSFPTDILPTLGSVKEIPAIIEKREIEEVIIALDELQSFRLPEILNLLWQYEGKILIKITPDLYHILLGTVRLNYPYSAVLMELKQDLMPKWKFLVKRTVDLFVSTICLLGLSPLLLYIAFRVKTSSKGSVFYAQDRVGLHGKPFTIYKFRSMYMEAEASGPQLSREQDERCTPWGATMRKWRLDELPQFWNVLKGDMSLVGPRPERKFYIDQITQKAPHFWHLLRVRPGITSWGQVQFGYASDVSQMIERLRYDILYIENMSLSLDVKILFYTLLVLIEGKGK